MQNAARITICLITLIALAGCSIGQRFIYHPDKSVFNKCRGFADAQHVSFNGTRMYISKPDKPLVIMYHGNAGSACDRAGYRQFIENANHGFIFVEYTGFGLNQPRPTHRRVKQDIRNVIAYLDRIGAKDITLMGESLGAAVASLHASQMRPKNLILISPFSTLADAAQAMFPRLPVKPFLFGRYDNLKALEGFEGNSMIIHGDADKLVPYRLGQKLAKSLPVSNQFVTVKGAGHNDLMAQPEAGQAITDFLKQN